MTAITHPLMRYHGSKFRLYPWLSQFFPEHTRYVEPFGGAGGVLLQKPRICDEVYNDLDQAIVNVFRVLQCDASRARLVELLTFTPFAREEFEIAWDESDDSVEQARRILIRSHMGFGSAGATKGSTGFRTCSRKRDSSHMHLWAGYPALLQGFAERVSEVLIESRPATGGRHYRHEMTDDDHYHLLKVLLDVEGMVMVSGYDNEMYMDMLDGWQQHSTKSRIAAGRGVGTRIEFVWLNPACSDAQRQQDLFKEGVK